MSSEECAKRLEEALEIKNCSVYDFLRDVFIFIGQKTNTYDASGNFIPAVDETRVLRLFRECNPNGSNSTDGKHPFQECGMFLPAAIAEEIEIDTSEDIESFCVQMEPDDNEIDYGDTAETEEVAKNHADRLDCFKSLVITNEEPKKEKPSIDLERDVSVAALEPFCKTPGARNSINSDSYNGAVRNNYSWSQSIGELDITIKIPDGITTSKRLKVNTTADSMIVEYLSNDSEWVSIINDKLSYKIRTSETVWVMSEGCIRIHLEKQLEKWWNSLLVSEPKINTQTLNCSRPLHELPEDQIEKVRELQFNHLQKLAGKPTSDDMKREEMLRRAWNAPGSPFMNTPFDPTVFNN